MPPNISPTLSPIAPKKKWIRIIVIGIVSLLVIAIVITAIIVGFNLWHQNSTTSQVKDELNKAVSAMESKRNETGAYPASITDTIASSNDKVTLNGSSSFDGTAYCITGTSSSDKLVVFHVDSTKAPQGPQSGTCETRSDLPAPSAPGGLAVAFANSNGVKVTWDAALYANSYTMQCSTDSSFSNPITTNVTDNAGMCEKLKSETTYYCRVKATNKTGDGNWSVVLKTKTN